MRLSLSMLAPLLVVLGWLWAGGAFEEPEPLPPNHRIASFVKSLAASPEVVVLGSSQSKSGVDGAALGAAIDRTVVKGTFAAASADLLFRVLQHRVIDEGHRPSLILLNVSLHDLGRPPKDGGPYAAEYQRRIPALDGPILGSAAAAPILRARAHWQVTKDAALERWTAWAEPDRRDTLMAQALGQRRQGRAELATRMIPVVESTEAREGGLDDSVVAAFAELARNHDLRVVLATLPQRRADLSSTAAERAAFAEWANAQGVGYADLEHVPMPASAWHDEGHLNPRGAEQYTTALAAALRDMGALGDGPIRKAEVHLADAISREGLPHMPVLSTRRTTGCGWVVDGELAYLMPANLERLGYPSLVPVELLGAGPLQRATPPCSTSHRVRSHRVLLELGSPDASPELSLHADEQFPMGGDGGGDLWLVPPGMRASWEGSLPEGTPVHVVLTRLTDGVGEPLVSIGARTLESRMDGLRVEARGRVSEPRTTVRIEVPPDGPWTVVDTLTVGEGHGTRWASSIPASDQVILLGDRSTKAILEDAAPAYVLDDPLDGRALVELPPRQAAVLHAPVLERVGSGECSPVRLTDGDEHRYLRRNAPAIPSADAGRPWRLTLDESRACRSNRWLYPGDTLETHALRPGVLHTEGRELVVSGAVFGRAATLHLTLRTDDGVLFDRKIHWRGTEEEIRVTLGRPVPPAPEGLSLTMSTHPAAPYVFLRQVRVEAGAPLVSRNTP